MSYSELNEAFEKYLNHKFTDQERLKFFEWISLKENEEDVRQYLNEQLNSFSPLTSVEDVDFDRIFSQIGHKTGILPSLPKKATLSFPMILKVAAIAVIVVLSTFMVHKIFQPDQVTPSEVVFFEIKAPLGAKSEITLPDGSHVWLNAGSSLKYNSGFSIMNRDIVLNGEAFFNVAKNKKLSFIVQTSEINIKAVGTSFNVKAYSDEGTIETTLVEGEIAIKRLGSNEENTSEVILKPQQKATFIKRATSLEVTDVRKFKEELPPRIKIESGKVFITPKINTDESTSWKDNLLIFRGEEMESMAIKLQRKYNVQIQIESDYIKRFRFSGTLFDETLEQVLDVIKLSAPIDYTINGKSVVISENVESRKRFKPFLKNEDK